MTDVSVRLRLIDDATKGFARLEQQVKVIRQHMVDEAKRAAEEEVRAAEQANARIRQNFSQFEQQTRAIQARIAADARRAAEERAQAEMRVIQQISDARERLNLRSHSQVRDDITHVRAAYQTLSTTANLTWREQVQAAERMRTAVRNLTNEMGHLTAAQRAYGAAQVGGGVIGGIGGGIAGAAYAMRTPVTNALELDRHLADIVNTAYPERDPKGRLTSVKYMSDTVHDTVKNTGIKLDGAVILLDALVASGVMTIQQVIDNLPLAAKTVVANRADPLAVAASMSKLYGSHVVNNDKESRIAQNMMVAAGQAGGNEYRYLSQYLPKQLAEGSGSGLLGLSGLRKILIMDEAAMLTAGSPEQANINVDNLLSKLNSHDTAKHLEKMGRGDLSAYLMKRSTQGVDSVTAILEIVQDEVRRDKVLKGHIDRLKKSKGQKNINSTIDSISAIGIGGVISELVPDRQARGSLYSLLNTEYTSKVAAAIDKAAVDRNGPNERNFETIAGTTSFKLDVLNNAIDASQKNLINENLTPNIAKAADRANSFSEEHPTIFKYLSAAPAVVSGVAGSAVGQMAGTAAAVVAAQRIFGAGAAETVAGGSLAASTTALLTRSSLAFNSTMANTTAFFSRLPAISRTATAYAAPYFPLLSKATAVTGVGYGSYQLASGVDTVIGKVMQMLTGHETKFSAMLGSALYDWSHNMEPIKVDTNTQITVGLAPGFVVTGQNSTTKSNAKAGENTATVKTGNMWKDVP